MFLKNHKARKVRKSRKTRVYQQAYPAAYENAFSDNETNLDVFSLNAVDGKKEQKKAAKKFINEYKKTGGKENKNLYETLIEEICLAIDSDTFVWGEDHKIKLREYLKIRPNYNPIYIHIYKEELAKEKQERIDLKARLDEFTGLTKDDFDKTIFIDTEEKGYDESRVQTIRSVLEAYTLNELLNKPQVIDTDMAIYVDGLIRGFLTSKDYTLNEYIEMKPKLHAKENIDFVLEKIDKLVSVFSYDQIVTDKKSIIDPDIQAIYLKYETEKYRKYKPENFETAPPVYDLDVLKTKKDISYNEFKYAYFSLTDSKEKKTVLENAIKAAQERGNSLRKTQHQDPVKTLYNDTNKNASLKGTLADEHVPFNNAQIDIVYRSMAEGNATPPWVILALWQKEGSGQKPDDVFVSSNTTSLTSKKANARTNVYYYVLGIDHFSAYTANPGYDNTVDVDTEQNGVDNESVFKARVTEQQNLGNLPKGRNFANEINNEITISGSQATFSKDFYSLSFMLAGAYYKQIGAELPAHAQKGGLKGQVPASLLEAIQEAKTKGDTDNLKRYEKVKLDYENNIDVGWEYLYWNQGGGNFDKTLASMQKHSKEQGVINQYGKIDETDFAFKTKPKASEYDQSRENAIRFRYYSLLYEMIFNGWK
jgi:hypothetical protein